MKSLLDQTYYNIGKIIDSYSDIVKGVVIKNPADTNLWLITDVTSIDFGYKCISGPLVYDPYHSSIKRSRFNQGYFKTATIVDFVR